MGSSSGYAGACAKNATPHPLVGAGCLIATVGQGLRPAHCALPVALLARCYKPRLRNIACPRWHIVRGPATARWGNAASRCACYKRGAVCCQRKAFRVRGSKCACHGLCVAAVRTTAYRWHNASHKKRCLWRCCLLCFGACSCLGSCHGSTARCCRCGRRCALCYSCVCLACVSVCHWVALLSLWALHYCLPYNYLTYAGRISQVKTEQHYCVVYPVLATLVRATLLPVCATLLRDRFAARPSERETVGEMEIPMDGLGEKEENEEEEIHIETESPMDGLGETLSC
jgi:hypothetical protein